MKRWLNPSLLAAGSLAALVLLASAFSIPNAYRSSLTAAIHDISVPALRTWQKSGGFARSLSQGASGVDVELIQLALATDPLLYPEQIINGLYGPLTKAAVERFQMTAALPATGDVGSQTQSALNASFYAELCPQAAPGTQDLSSAHLSKRVGLPDGYVPPSLTDITKLVPTAGIICVTADTASALSALVAAARADHVQLFVCSGYRAAKVQDYILRYYEASGSGSTLDTAPPGHSEHETGTAVDFSGASIENQCADSAFGSSPEYLWLAEHASSYGFELSYPPGNSEYAAESWHWRYVGSSTAVSLQEQGVSFDGWKEPF